MAKVNTDNMQISRWYGIIEQARRCWKHHTGPYPTTWTKQEGGCLYGTQKLTLPLTTEMGDDVVMPKKPLEHERYGRLEILESVRGGWLSRCDCGTVLIVKGTLLRRGQVVSCGCYHRERQREAPTSHGMTKSPTHITWTAMRQRCNNPNNPSWPNYGGRGIRVCPRWESFENFYADMGPRPEGTTIERIDNDGHYEPANCRWASRLEQGANKQDTIRIQLDGRSQSLSEWCKELGINYWTAHARIKRGATPLEAISR